MGAGFSSFNESSIIRSTSHPSECHLNISGSSPLPRSSDSSPLPRSSDSSPLPRSSGSHQFITQTTVYEHQYCSFNDFSKQRCLIQSLWPSAKTSFTPPWASCRVFTFCQNMFRTLMLHKYNIDLQKSNQSPDPKTRPHHEFKTVTIPQASFHCTCSMKHAITLYIPGCHKMYTIISGMWFAHIIASEESLLDCSRLGNDLFDISSDCSLDVLVEYNCPVLLSVGFSLASTWIRWFRAKLSHVLQ